MTFGSIIADPPWRFTNRTGKVAPEHGRLHRYHTMKLTEIMALPVGAVAAPAAHLYLWTPNALLPDALRVMDAWGFEYKTNIPWLKIRKDGGPDGRGVGFYFRNVTELVLFGVKRARGGGERSHAGAWSSAGQHHPEPEAGALAEAGGVVPARGGVLTWPASGAVRPRPA